MLQINRVIFATEIERAVAIPLKSLFARVTAALFFYTSMPVNIPHSHALLNPSPRYHVRFLFREIAAIRRYGDAP